MYATMRQKKHSKWIKSLGKLNVLLDNVINDVSNFLKLMNKQFLLAFEVD